MSEPHPLGIYGATHDSSKIEISHPEFDATVGLMQARQKTIDAMQAIRVRLEAGMTEDDARKLALAVFSEHGATKHWHRPYIRFGAGTCLTYHDPLQQGAQLRPGDPYYLDFGPVWPGQDASSISYEGDYGDTFVFGENPAASACAEAARQLFNEARAGWSLKKWSGREMYRFLEGRASELGYVLTPHVDGHRISDFPHHKYSKSTLAEQPFVPTQSLWVLEVHITSVDRQWGAFFEDVL